MILIGPGANTDPIPKYEFTEMPPGLPADALRILIQREPFSDLFTLTLPNGHTEEVYWDEVDEWFKVRGADMDAAKAALDYVWNFGEVDFVIAVPKNPLHARGKHAPKI